MDQGTREKPPLLLRIGLAVIGIAAMYGAARYLTMLPGLAAVPAVGWLAWALGLTLNSIALICVEAAWRLRRWGALGIIIVVAWQMIEWSTLFVNPRFAGRPDFHPWRVLAFAFVVRVLPLVPLALYWRRLK